MRQQGGRFDLPDVKPLTELGLRGLVVPGWNGVMAPKGTTAAVIGTLRDALRSEASVCGFNAVGRELKID